MRLTVGTHNLLDGVGRATPFADLILFTEAVPYAVRQDIGDTHAVRSCPQQRDLTIAWNLDLDVQEIGDFYHLAHNGRAEVTPHRGTWVQLLKIEGERIKVPVTHRINAAHPPYIRGEAAFRRRNWQHHKRIDTGIVRRAIDTDWHVIAGGDYNTPPHVLAFPLRLGLAEEKRGLDRIATTGRIVPGSVDVLSHAGSDHPRLRVEVTL